LLAPLGIGNTRFSKLDGSGMARIVAAEVNNPMYFLVG
jgi:hypothetical protein